jgi:hypothetical protein
MLGAYISHWPTLGQMVGYLGDCVGLYFGCLVVWTLLKKRRPRHARLWMTYLAKYNSLKDKANDRDGFLNMRQAFVLFVWMMIFMVYKAATASLPTEQYVAVIRVVSPYRYTFQHVDQRSLQLVGDPFTEDICHDYASPGDDFREGLILKKVIHTEEGCWSLNPDKHCGFFKLRDPETTKPIFLKEYARNQYD